MSKPSIWWFASGEYKKLSPSANSTRSSTEWGQDIKTMPNKTSTRLYGTKTKWKNYPLAFPNNSTIFAHTILSYFSTPCPLSTRLGAFSYPETFSRKFFPKFFPILPRRLFSVFLVRKIMGVKGFFRPQIGGGGCHLLHPRYIVTGISRSPPSLHQDKRASNQGKTGQNLIFICLILSYLGKIGDNNVQDPNIFLKCGVCVWCRVCLSWWCSIVSTGGLCAGFRTFRTCRMPALVLLCRVPAFLSALSLCL